MNFINKLICRQPRINLEDQASLAAFNTLPAHEDILNYPIKYQWSVSAFHNEIREAEVLMTTERDQKVVLFHGPPDSEYKGLENVKAEVLLWANQYANMAHVIEAVLPLKPNTIAVQLANENFCTGDEPHLFTCKTADHELANGFYSYQKLESGKQHTYLHLKGKKRVHVGTTFYIEPCRPTASTCSLANRVVTGGRSSGDFSYFWDILDIKVSDGESSVTSKSNEAVTEKKK